MALQVAPTPSTQFAPLPTHEIIRPISTRDEGGVTDFEQVRRNIAAPDRAHTGAGTARPEGAPGPEPTGVRTVSPVLTTGVHAPNRLPTEAGTAPQRLATFAAAPPEIPSITLGNIRELLVQAAGRTQLARNQPAGAAPFPEPINATVPPAPAATTTAAPAGTEPVTPVGTARLAELGPEIAAATARARFQSEIQIRLNTPARSESAAQERTPRTEGAPGIAPRPRVLIDQLL